MKKIIFYLSLLIALSGSTVFADEGNLKVNDEIITATDTSKQTQSSIAYQVAPNLFIGKMDKQNQSLKKDKTALVSYQQQLNFTKHTKKESSADVKPIVTQLFKKGSLTPIPASNNKTNSSSILNASWVFGSLTLGVTISATILGIFLGQKYAQWFRKKV